MNAHDNGDGIVVVGAGLAGLFTALKLAPLPVTVISPARLGEGASSLWAQAGLAAALAEGDTPEHHAEDTIRAGAGIVDEKVALLMAQEARERIEDLLRYGVPFDKDLEGRLSLSHEAAHRNRRILHVKGDTAGRAIMGAITEAARTTPSIRVLEGLTAHDLIVHNGRVQGISLAPVDGEAGAQGLVLPARAVVLATGGAGQVYGITTNPLEARGGGVAIAARAGAVIADAEFIQFHPTAIDIGRAPPRRCAAKALSSSMEKASVSCAPCMRTPSLALATWRPARSTAKSLVAVARSWIAAQSGRLWSTISRL